MRSMIPLVRHICVMNLGHLAGAALVGSLTIVTVCALAQALASLHLLQSANGCWCSTKPCLDRCSTTPNDKHMQGRGVPSAQQAEEDAVVNQVGRRAGPSQQTLGILVLRGEGACVPLGGAARAQAMTHACAGGHEFGYDCRLPVGDDRSV